MTNILLKAKQTIHARTILAYLAAATLTATQTACTGMIYEDRDGCEHGVWLSLKYDYNLQRADMMEHVGSVGVFVYNEQGRFVTSFIEPDLRRAQPLNTIYLDLPEGSYHFLAVAQQRAFSDVQAGPGADFLWTDPTQGEPMDNFSVELEHTDSGKGYDLVDHGGLPLDTLWHGASTEATFVPSDRYVYHELSLIRDTKSISVAMREVDHPEEMDVADYDFYISARDLTMDYDAGTHDLTAPEGQRTAVYTPYATWNTDDTSTQALTTRTGLPGRTAHADFMTSRLYAHQDANLNARLTVRSRDTGDNVIEADLCNLLGQLRNYDETRRYSLQEFLDRGYDFRLTFFLKGGEWQYVDVSIGVLGWSKRIQNVAL